MIRDDLDANLRAAIRATSRLRFVSDEEAMSTLLALVRDLLAAIDNTKRTKPK